MLRWDSRWDGMLLAVSLMVGYIHLIREFFGGQALGFCKTPTDNFDHKLSLWSGSSDTLFIISFLGRWCWMMALPVLLPPSTSTTTQWNPCTSPSIFNQWVEIDRWRHLSVYTLFLSVWTLKNPVALLYLLPQSPTMQLGSAGAYGGLVPTLNE